MKVVQGEFGKSKEAMRASDLFQTLADAVDEMEEEGVDVKTAIVIFSDKRVLSVPYQRIQCFLLLYKHKHNMRPSILLLRTLRFLT